MHSLHIRSFVRRNSGLTSLQRWALDHLWAKYGLEISNEPFDLSFIFPQERPVVLEIGFGSGVSLLNMAVANPEYNYIGVEVYLPGIATVLLGLEEQSIANVRLLNADAIEVLQHAIPDDSLQQVLLFFPDPWPKRRHHKRRIVNADFAALVERKLKLGGTLHMATDWDDYAQQMLKVFSAAPGFVNLATSGGFCERPTFRPLTKYELRGDRLGHQVRDLMFRKGRVECETNCS